MAASKALAMPRTFGAPAPLSPGYQEIVIGLVYYAGATGSTFCDDVRTLLADHGYPASDVIKVSALIAERAPEGTVPPLKTEGRARGRHRLKRVFALQDQGDALRQGNPAVLAALAIERIRLLRGGPPTPDGRRAFIIDSLKHRDEVELLRLVYGSNFRLIAIHCSRVHRKERLLREKFRSAKREDVERFLDRDEQDRTRDWGQEVNKVFYQADYFIDNNHPQEGVKYLPDLKRFMHLCVGGAMARPTVEETGMYHAQASALRSACLSRQVGAAILSPEGRLLALGTNDVPKSGGGLYHDGDSPDHRCFRWAEWCACPDDPRWTTLYDESPVGTPHCHNSRRKHELRRTIGDWLADRLAPVLGERVAREIGSGGGGLFVSKEKARIEALVREILHDPALLRDMPGIQDLIEYSRSIHAEMDALMSALRSGLSTVGATLYCTTYPCHHCARHIVAAGIGTVYYMEPFIKSLALELHHDALVHDAEEVPGKVSILPFTGVGPRLYGELFLKEGEWKTETGRFQPPRGAGLRRTIQLDSLDAVEQRAARLARPASGGAVQRIPGRKPSA
ncbi:anti-phage dCTP deaminase [Pararhodospirillum oryzae]|uniref:Deoxycytidylate deaminase n=1 Tax=Pararhodospirillum oryzae TaxID=478448 RepID=A0A512H575_9PROT|nr:anti-phage dCTP deaminase [Pararhodospirillum oryzae]GEO80622.1 deoxycytidylate deaminase [Pararhodospirillum oryzae]